MYPSYLDLYHSGELATRAEVLMSMLESCRVCPRNCRVNRLKGKAGSCFSGYLPIVSSFCAHFGEEPVLVGQGGSGTIFFGNCNLRCVYCQNSAISQNPHVEKNNEMEFEKLAEKMIQLQERGCHNINLVSPTQFVPQIIKSLIIAVSWGLNIPIVYNTNSYDSVEVLRLLDGIIDIYLPDIKYSNDEMALRYSKVKNYVLYSRAALKEMFRQVGLLETDKNDIAQRGMIIRHLVLPDNIAGTKESLQFLAEELSPLVTVSVMSQYHPAHKALEYSELNRFISTEEYNRAVEWLDIYGFENGWTQDHISCHHYLPNFNLPDPFTT